MMDLLRKELFWDVNPKTVDIYKHIRFVIERVLTRGELEDWKMIKQIYSLNQLREYVVQMRNMEPRLLSFCSVVLDIPRENFRCYKNSVWPPIH